VVEEWSSLLWPGDDIDWGGVQKAFDVNGLSRAKLEGKPMFKDIRGRVDDALAGERVWVAHNTPFDMKMLQQEYARAGRDMPVPDFALDTMMLDVHCNRYEKSRKLGDVTSRWGIRLDGAHRASADAVACGRVLHAMLESGRLPDTIEALYAAQAECRTRWDEHVRSKHGRR